MKPTFAHPLALLALVALSHRGLLAAEADAAADAGGASEPSATSEGEPGDASETSADVDASAATSVSATTAEDSSGHPSPLELALGAKVYSRAFRYTDTLAQLSPTGGYPDLITYNLDAAPMPFIEGSYFPLATATQSKVLQNIGLTGSFEMGVGTNVAYGQARYDQMHYRLFVGLRGRIPIGPITVNPLAGYGAHQFSLSGGATPPPFPNVAYSLIEAGLGAEWRASPVILRAQGRFLYPIGVGDIKSAAWFPNASALGAHFGGQVGFIVNERFTVLATVDVRTYGFNFNPIPPGTPPERVAGGAVDRYVSAGLAIEYRIPEKKPTASQSNDGAPNNDEFDF